jgi:hypothetical protein
MGTVDENGFSIMKKLPHQQAINGLQPLEAHPSLDRLLLQGLLPPHMLCISHRVLEQALRCGAANPG